MRSDFPKLEKEVLEFWREKRIFAKSLEQRRKAPPFVFYEGPPTANARPGIHHVLARVFKDIICRYKTMQGFRVERKAGWDTHGLPVELEIEKKLGLKNKREIEEYGIAKFNEQASQSVWEYKRDWEELTERIGYWLDMANPYITSDPLYIETVWFILKQAWEKKLLYEGFKVVPWCPRCGTTLSSHEVAQGYEKITENSVYLKFKVLSGQKMGGEEVEEGTYLLSWTTTPWTLPGNVALAVHPDLTYVKAKKGEAIFILAKARADGALGQDYEIEEQFLGKELAGLAYEPFFEIKELQTDKSHRVSLADFVSEEEGTGIVHTAVMYGEDDFELGTREGLPKVHTVEPDGRFNKLVKGFEGLNVKASATEKKLIEFLESRGALFKQEPYTHDYPFCWRCHHPLLYYAKRSWFIKMTALRDRLLANNSKINWVPSHMKEGRFGEWLREVKDWAFSRERYWGTPLPIWQCQIGNPQNPRPKTQRACNNLVIIGSREDLWKQKFTLNQYFILRHGQTPYQREKKEIVYPFPEETPIVLTKKGEGDVRRAAKKLKREKIDLIFTSDTTRARQTAEIVAEALGLKVSYDKRLRDIDLGRYNGASKKTYYRAFPNPLETFYRRPEGGESRSDVKRRMLEFVREVEQRHQGKRILIVSHGAPLRLLEAAMKGLLNKEYFTEQAKIPLLKTAEIRKIEFKTFPFNDKGELDFHRPFVDEVRFFCPQCGGLMERRPEVIDCWFDSGAMPFAQGHWPFAYAPEQRAKRTLRGASSKNQTLAPPELFPADYITEAVDQTRGWFYTLLAISTLLGYESSFRNVISLGHILDEKGEKMSKSKGNVVDPWKVIEKYGADSVRWYFFRVNQPGNAKFFNEKDVATALKKFLLPFWHSYVFFETYVLKKNLKLQAQNSQLQLKTKNLLDRWIISRLNNLVSKITGFLDEYDITRAARRLESFVVDDLSQWYVRRSRRRFQQPQTERELAEASSTLAFVLATLCQLTAPFTPFLSERVYRNLSSKAEGQPLSIHLTPWPKPNKRLRDKKLEERMAQVREVVSIGLNLRAKAGIKVRQPLRKLRVKSLKFKVEEELLALMKEEINVKEIVFDDNLEQAVELDTKITPKLKEEGQMRELVRLLQMMRKEAGLIPEDKIAIKAKTSPSFQEKILKNKDYLFQEVNVKTLDFSEEDLQGKEAAINGHRIVLTFTH